MTKEQQIENDVIESMREWSEEKFYNTFGSWLETVVNNQKRLLQVKLKYFWAYRRDYSFRDTGEKFEDDTMLFYFSNKRIAYYSIAEMEAIIKRIEEEAFIAGADQ